MPETHIPVSIAASSTAYTVQAYNSGITHYVADLSADCTFTLPSPKAGLWFEFAYAGVAADASNWIITTGSNTNYFIGGLVFLDSDDAVSPIAGNGSSNSKVTIVTPAPGTRFMVESINGTTWCLSGFAHSATIPSFADQ